MRGAPSQLFLRLCAGSRAVNSCEVRDPTKMAGGLLGRLADNRHFQTPSDDARDVLERHALVGDPVVPGSRGTLFNREPVKMGSIEPVHRGPTVLTITYICRNPFFARDGDETRDKTVIAVAMHRGREEYHRRAKA